MPGENLLLQSFSPALLSALKARLRPTPYKAGEILFVAGDKIVNVYFMRSGAISLVTELAGGQMIESAMIGRDSLVAGGAALDDRDAVYKAIVQVTGEALLLDVDSARHIARNHEEFRTAVIRHEQLILAQAQQSAACNAAHHLNERLARWLLRVRDVTGRDEFMLTQDFIAEMLGVGRTSVSLVAYQLQQGGLIAYRRGHITIENLEALQDAACECYDTVKNHYERVRQSAGST